MNLFFVIRAAISTLIILNTSASFVFPQTINDDSDQTGHGYEFDGNGKDINASKQGPLYQPWPQQKHLAEALLGGGDKIIKALLVQQKYLDAQINRIYRYDSISFDNNSFRKVIEKLLGMIRNDEHNNDLKFYRIKGEDGKGNVHFTGYFTPVLEARREADAVFNFPIYQKPANWEGLRPTRAMIDWEKILAGRGLEVAWTSSLLENYFIQVQGSGYLRFGDGSLSLLVFSGQNGYAYTSIGKYLVGQGHIDASEISLPSITEWFRLHPDSLESVLNRNKSYAFFSLSDDIPRGAAHTELVQGHSIAVDPKYIPLGAVLLAKIPVLDKNGKLLQHEFRIVTAQDRGGAIKGPGHVDLYEGIGEEASHMAGSLHHYGALWLILMD